MTEEYRPARRVFYKYMTAEVAKTVLATRRLRWGSPLRFNDPFDVTQELRLNFDEHQLQAAIKDRLVWLLEHGDEAPAIVRQDDHSTLLRGMLDALKRATPDARRALATEIRNDPSPAPVGQGQALQLLKDEWSARVPTFRILCLSEVNDSTRMWHYYADDFRGVVLEFSALDEVNSAFLEARPVVYKDEPRISDANAWARCLLGEEGTSYRSLFLEYVHVKTPDWSSEREWRIASLGRRPDDDDDFGDYGFHPRELTAIYFGPTCSEENRADLLNLLVHGLQHVQRYQMSFDTAHARMVAGPVHH